MLARKGIKVTAGGREWVVPSITRGEHRRMAAAGVFEKKDAFDFGTFGEADATLALTALRHNYPDLGDDGLDGLTPEEIGQLARAAIYATLGLDAIPETPGPGAESPKADATGSATSKT